MKSGQLIVDFIFTLADHPGKEHDPAIVQMIDGMPWIDRNIFMKQVVELRAFKEIVPDQWDSQRRDVSRRMSLESIQGGEVSANG